MRRVVVTGLGILSPLGVGVKANWEGIVSGKGGISKITRFEVSDLSSQIAGQVPYGDGEAAFNPDRFIEPKEQKKMDIFIHYAMAAADEAIADSGYVPADDEARERAGVLIGSGIGGLNEIYETSIVMHARGARRVSPFFIPRSLINLASGQVSIKHGYRGPNHAVVTACATGSHSIGDAARLIMLGDADVMVAGGAEAAVCRIGMAGFCAMRALSTSYNDTPEKASRPYDKGRDGFIMGEGAGVLVLEEYEHAKKRGAKIYGEVIGYGLSGDAYHMSAPAEDGNGGYRAMKAAVARAGISPEQIDYINAHGTSTLLGDEIEVRAVKRLFGGSLSKVMMSSTKSAIGHLLGAAGAVEAIYCLKAMENGIVPPTLNLEDVSEECEGIDLVPLKAKEKKLDIVLSNSFGFGGTNASLLFRRV
ncbi:MAG: beta-ketoacyl-[acyl-carrier-protein] synthase II [Proteobacteria bacterium]|jgi:3-oxoacyl-[acyl-carrier-protein] synthase II|nr:beta-ketoacyl-ACP synthase II [Alphaproteobacteria bacterium]NCC03285.1 beta-ketoacyl-[acyl-carrier-protein] synthase II [Pseudomonadota bacterium]